MKLAGFLLLLSGWAIALAAVVLLASVPRVCFLLAGMGVEVLGLVLAVRSHLVLRGERG